MSIGENNPIGKASRGDSRSFRQSVCLLIENVSEENFHHKSETFDDSIHLQELDNRRRMAQNFAISHN